jgi:hypothetical protein
MACSPTSRQGATLLGAYRYPDQTDVRAHSTTVSPTWRPAQCTPFYTERLALGSIGHHFHASWCPVGHRQLTCK